MNLLLNILEVGGAPLPAGSPLTVEVRDTSLADAPAIVLQQVRTVVPLGTPTTALPVKLKLESVPDGTTVWVHIDTDRDGRVSTGDFITVQSYPLTSGPFQTLTVRVKEVR